MMAIRPPTATTLLTWKQLGPEIEIMPSEFDQTYKVSIRPMPTKKTVRFSESNEICPVQHLDDYTDAEVASIWYDASDYGEIKSDYKHTVLMMECSKSLPDEEYTSRGLEYRTQRGAWARHENKRAAYGAVLDEQDIQWSKNKDDHDRLATVYSEHTAKTAKAAYLVALKDARAARDVYDAFFWGGQSASKNSGPDSGRWSMTKSLGQIFSSKRMLST